MKVRRLLLRYYPPGISVEYQRRNGDIHMKTIDLLELAPDSDVDTVVSQLVTHPLLSTTQRSILCKLVYKLIDKISVKTLSIRFENFRTIPPHILPLTNCAFNKDGSQFITGSYDRSCKYWDTFSGVELSSFENGHDSVVYALSFNTPY